MKACSRGAMPRRWARTCRRRGGAQFRVIDPPRVSPEPVAPNRVDLLASRSRCRSAQVSSGCFIASELRPIFHDARTLREVTRRQILGMVSLLPSDAMQKPNAATRICSRAAWAVSSLP